MRFAEKHYDFRGEMTLDDKRQKLTGYLIVQDVNGEVTEGGINLENSKRIRIKTGRLEDDKLLIVTPHPTDKRPHALAYDLQKVGPEKCGEQKYFGRVRTLIREGQPVRINLENPEEGLKKLMKVPEISSGTVSLYLEERTG